MPQHELIALFRKKAEAVHAVVEVVAEWQGAFQRVVDLAGERGGGRITAPGLAPDRTEALGALCRERELDLVTENVREQGDGFILGLTAIDWGIAETGTLVLDAASEDLRLATMLPDIHAALLPARRIKAAAGDLRAEIEGMAGSPPGYLTFITGASRTADIERELTIGVHGPSELRIFIITGDNA